MHGFTAESLRRQLTIPEAACLWCELPFSAISLAMDLDDGLLHSLEHPALNQAMAALIEATNSGELECPCTDDGYPVAIARRTVSREDLRDWIAAHHPHRPALLFAVPQATHPNRAGRPAEQSHGGVVRGLRHPQADAATSAAQPLPTSAVAGDTLTTHDVLALFGIVRATLENWIAARGFPPPFQAVPGGKRRWDKAAVLAWKRQHEEPKV